MKANIAKLLANVHAVDMLLRTYPCDIPDELVNISVSYEPTIDIDVLAAPNEHGRQKLMATVGDVFGRDGWVKEPRYDNEYYHWVKTVDSVRLKLCSCEQLPAVPTVPVAPKEFPLLLADIPTEVLE